MEKKDLEDLEDLFSPYGKIIDVNMEVERRQPKLQSQQSPPRRAPYNSYSDGKEPQLRSRSPVYRRDAREPRDIRDGREPRDIRDGREPRDIRDGREPRDIRDGREPRDIRARREPRDIRDGREPRDSHDRRDPGREPRPSSHSRDHDSRYRSSVSRDKDLRSEPRDPAFSRDDRYYRSGNGAEDYRKKDEPYRDPYRDPWNGRREAEAADDRTRPEERQRNELYRQYYEELQRRSDTDRPVDCSVIVVNKSQKEYAETVGRKVRDLGMVVDLIFLNTEVSLTQALEDVGRARTPFAIIITQQHQVHRSCTVNILFGTPQEHRNMPMQDAMMLVGHNYESYKVENREKEREEIARKAAKMADDVLLREADRESHPVSVLTTITLLSENRFVTPDELDSLIAYLSDKRARLLRSTEDPLAGHVSAPAAAHSNIPASAAGLPPPSHSTHAPPQSSHLGLSAASSASANSSHQQELQAKILSLFNSGSGASASVGMPATSQPQAYSSLGPSLSQNPSHQIPPSSTAGINFDYPSVQKALDTIIQSGPSLSHLVGAGASQQPAPGMGQVPPMSILQASIQNVPTTPVWEPRSVNNYMSYSVARRLKTLFQNGISEVHTISSEAAKAAQKGRIYKSYKIVNEMPVNNNKTGTLANKQVHY
ncbi:Nuclear receptor coactivator 5 [Collichthys lucidus]|uniref:Nuclear receptor coactivator 5 n=1 Tax=Collichthys lucidus TaxID=240159 RepID=A0A4U5U8M5_COLLU|nr:Nuclear receptor coactivator 5 [Collichthys lucidus]